VTLTAKQAHSESIPLPDDWFEAAFRKHWPQVYQIVYRLVGERAEAEDLAVETFLRLHRRPPSLDDQKGLRGWLYRVATNLGLNALRSRQRRQHYEQAASKLQMSETPDSDPAKQVEQRQKRAQVRAVLAQMKPRAAQILLLRYSDQSYAEVAAALGIAKGSVGTLLARAEAEFERRYRELEGA